MLDKYKFKIYDMHITLKKGGLEMAKTAQVSKAEKAKKTRLKDEAKKAAKKRARDAEKAKKRK